MSAYASYWEYNGEKNKLNLCIHEAHGLVEDIHQSSHTSTCIILIPCKCKERMGHWYIRVYSRRSKHSDGVERGQKNSPRE